MNSKKSSLFRGIVGLSVIAVAIAAILVFTAMTQQKNSEIDSFQACKDAGGTIAESYPEQCFIDDKSFTNDQQSLDNEAETTEYIGLTEQESLDRAANENKAARVVERDDEALPVTMDFMPGRLNLYVKDDKVYKVQVEGEE